MRRCQREPTLLAATAITVAVAWLAAAAPDAAGALTLAPYDADSECTNTSSTANSSRPLQSVKVLLDSYSYLSLDSLWFADDESIDLFTFPIPEDPEVWELVDNIDCRNIWRYCGDSISDILLTQFISTGGIAGTELIIQIDYAFVSETDPSSPLTCSAASSEENSADNENILIVEADDTFTVYSEAIPCGAEGRLINASSGIHQYEFTYVPRDSFEVVLRSNLSEDSCVYVSRIQAFHHICPETRINYVHYAPTPGGVYSGTCVPNAQPLLNTENNITAKCSRFGEWIFPPNLTSSSHCLCAPGYFPDSLGIECLPCSNGTYKEGFWQESCQPCPRNSHTDDRGSFFCPCNAAFTRTDPSDVDSDCNICATHYFPTEVTCNPCPAPGSRSDSVGILLEECMCLNGTTTSNSTQDGNFTRDLNTTTCVYCAQDYYRSQINESCLLCPASSFRDPRVHSENTCYCTVGSLTADGQTNTTIDPCSKCDTTYFLFESSCQPCPEYSSSLGLNDTACICESGTTTRDGSSATTGDPCVCNTGLFRSQDGSCVPCPLNSNRSSNSHDDYCPCETGYARRPEALTTEQCYGPVVGFSTQTVQVLEGDSTNVVTVRVYSTFHVPRAITVNLNVTNPAQSGSIFIDQLTFPVGETQADYHVIVQGDEIALESDQTVQLQLIQSDNVDNYIIGSGDVVGNQSYHSAINVNIREDDIVFVGFTKSNISATLSSQKVLELVMAISTDIARDLAVLVTSNVSLSVFNIKNSVATFLSSGSLHLVIPIQLSKEPNPLVDIYFVGVTLELVEEEYLRNEVRIGGRSGFNERLTLTLLPRQSTQGLTQGAEIGIISACASVLLAVLALAGVLIFCHCRQKYKEKHYSKNSCSSEDDFDSTEGKQIELRPRMTRIQ